MKTSRRSKISQTAWLLAAGFLAVATMARGESKPSSSPETNPQALLAWNITNLVTAYEKAGFANAKWDGPAKTALTEFARMRARVPNTQTNVPWYELVGKNCDQAIKAGCKDPLIAYLHTRTYLDQSNTPAVFEAAFVKAARDMQPTSYHKLRKFFACFRAAEQIQYAWGTNHLNELLYFQNLAMTNLNEALEDRSLPLIEVDDAGYEAAASLSENKWTWKTFYELVQQPLSKSWTNASVGWYLRGEFHIRKAWEARGSGYAYKVTDAGWKGFDEQIQEARKTLETAWEINPKRACIPTKMLTVELGLEPDRDRMEEWFNRAMELDKNCYKACEAKLYYLEPKWHGSPQELIQFGRECADSEKWGANIPLILSDAHEALARYVDKTNRMSYWKQPEVWPDIQKAFDKFFKLNPDAVGYRHNYARFAYWCEQWETLNSLIPQLGPVNYSYFGGEPEYKEMVRRAKAHTSKSATSEKP